MKRGLKTAAPPRTLASAGGGPNNRPDEKGIEKRRCRPRGCLGVGPNNRPDEKGIEKQKRPSPLSSLSPCPNNRPDEKGIEKNMSPFCW
jgi:hypothetical protein